MVELHGIEAKELGVLVAVERGIRQEQRRGTALDDGTEQRGRGQVVDGLRGQHHGGVLLAPGLEALFHIRTELRVLDEPPGLVHQTELQASPLARVHDLRGDAMQHVEQQRFQERRIVPHRLKIEDLKCADRQGVLDVVEQPRIPTALDPPTEAMHQGARQHVREGEQPPLLGVEDVDVLHRLVELPVLRVRELIVVRTLEQHADKRVQEVQIFWRG